MRPERACATSRSRWISCTAREASEEISGSIGSHITVGRFIADVHCQLAVAGTAIMADLFDQVAEAFRFSSPFISAFGELTC